MPKGGYRGATTELGKLQEERFAAAYVAGGCKSSAKAAESIGLSKSHGADLLKRKSVKQHIQSLVLWQTEKTIRNSNELSALTELATLSYSDIADVVELRDGMMFLKDGAEIPDHATRAIRKITFKQRWQRGENAPSEPDQEVCVEMHDKRSALESLLRHLGIDKPKDNSAEKLGSTLIDVIKARMSEPDDPLEA
jgi:hypothetical protein